MFGIFKKHKSVDWSAKTFLSPANGKLIPIGKVSDPVFAQKAMGDGFAINPDSNDIYSPVSGKVTLVADTKHGIGISTDDGEEILVHMGIDTVDLNGEPFKVYVSKGDKISAGQKIATMNLDKVESAGKETTIIVVMTNSSDKGMKISLEPVTQIEHSELVAKV
ncbi:PTS sugar transporter subunit IIA [Companilactobacillus insicii]|uniref:PTS sugar transporter subunit IIA n=1 Tax=Companilactobacillus insicii TaxID=1732567 RepID=UPI000F7885D2|nr:PTS glucose transporter subunit IIA [Companilactobacillus insicii]